MRLGIVQTDPSDPNTLQIVNQETGERVDNLSWCEMEYDVMGVQTIKAEFKVCRKTKQTKPKFDINKMTTEFMKDVYAKRAKEDVITKIETGVNPFDNIGKQEVRSDCEVCEHHSV